MRIRFENQNERQLSKDKELLNAYLLPQIQKKLNIGDYRDLEEIIQKLCNKSHLGSASSARFHHYAKLRDTSTLITFSLTDKPHELIIHFHEPRSSLFKLIELDSIDEFKQCIERENIDINSIDKNGISLLSHAIIHQKLPIFEYLINHPQIDLNLTDPAGWSPLYRTTPLQDTHMLERLIQKGAKLNLKNKDGSTALHRAVDSNNLPAVKILVEKGADPNRLNFHGTPLLAAARKGFTEIAQFLIAHGAEVNKVTDPMGITPLMMAITNGHESTAQCLTQAGGLKKAPLAKGSPTVLTFKEGTQMEPLKDNVNVKDLYGRTAAHLWAYHGNQRLGLALLKIEKTNFDITDNFGRTPLHYAVWEGYLPVVESLLAKKVNVNSQDRQGYFPLHWASQFKNRTKIAEFLIKNGADVNMKDNFGWTAFRKAAENNNVEMGELLFNTGRVNINETTPDGKTALHRAAINGSYEFAEFLIFHGADCHAIDNAGKHPIDYAGQNKKMTELLAD